MIECEKLRFSAIERNDAVGTLRDKRRPAGYLRPFPEKPTPYLMLARFYGQGSTMRFLSADPGDDVDAENPQSWNPYAYVRNNPIASTDPDGRKFEYLPPPKTGDKKKDKFHKQQWNEGKKAFKVLLKTLAKADPRFKQMIKDLKHSDNVIKIEAHMATKNETTKDNVVNASNGVGTGSTITFDPFNRLNEGGDSRDPIDGVAHELSHAEDNDTGTNDINRDPQTGCPGEKGTEVKAVQMENIMRRANGEQLRERGPKGGYIPNHADPPSNPRP